MWVDIDREKGSRTVQVHFTRQSWHGITQLETFLCHLDEHHEVLVVIKVTKGLVMVSHGYSKVKLFTDLALWKTTVELGQGKNSSITQITGKKKFRIIQEKWDTFSLICATMSFWWGTWVQSIKKHPLCDECEKYLGNQKL